MCSSQIKITDGLAAESVWGKPGTNNQHRAHIGLRSFVRTRHCSALGDTRNRQEWPLTCIYRS